MKGISTEHWLDSAIQTAVIQQLGNVFSDDDHYYDHEVGFESDHGLALMRSIIKAYLATRLKTYGKAYTQVIAHGDKPSPYIDRSVHVAETHAF